MTGHGHIGATLEGARAWVISDGKAGHEAQSLGVAEALGLDVEIKRVDPKGIYRLAAPWAPVRPGEGVGRPGSLLAPPFPSIAIAAGRTTIPYIRALKRAAGLTVFTVVLMDPRTGARTADLIWVPEHDRRRGANVMRTFAAPHRFSSARLEGLRAAPPASIAALPWPRIACLVGGPNGDYAYSEDDTARLADRIERMAADGAGLMVTTSRRTPPALVAKLKMALSRSNTLFWSGEGANPYPDFLASADAFIVTADSVSMLCEAAATGRPVYVFEPSGGGAKFQRFHAGLAAQGVTRPLPGQPGEPLASWSYPPLQSAEVIAEEIRRRWQRRADLLPGLVARGKA